MVFFSFLFRVSVAQNIQALKLTCTLIVLCAEFMKNFFVDFFVTLKLFSDKFRLLLTAEPTVEYPGMRVE